MPANLTPLVADLNSDNRAHRVRAAEEFSRLGSEAAPAAVALVEACGDESEEVREYVMAALEELGPPGREAIEPLVALLPHPTADTGYWAATLLGRLERHAAPAVPALVATSPSMVPNTHRCGNGRRGPWGKSGHRQLRPSNPSHGPQLPVIRGLPGWHNGLSSKSAANARSPACPD